LNSYRGATRRPIKQGRVTRQAEQEDALPMGTSIQSFRGAAMYDMLTTRGWGQETSQCAMFALHPFDEVGTRVQFDDGSIAVAPVPHRAFEKAVRKRSREFARALGGVSEQTAVRLSEAAWSDYRRLASEHGEDYYVKRFAQLSISRSS
jgi:hypothetical protein